MRFTAPADFLCLQGITFNAISVRIALRQSETLTSGASRSFGNSHHPHATEGQVATIGSIPMRPMPISISITKDVEAHGDRGSDSQVDYAEGMYDRKTGEEIATVH